MEVVKLSPRSSAIALYHRMNDCSNVVSHPEIITMLMFVSRHIGRFVLNPYFLLVSNQLATGFQDIDELCARNGLQGHEANLRRQGSEGL